MADDASADVEYSIAGKQLFLKTDLKKMLNLFCG
jgi:hypothetical protein